MKSSRMVALLRGVNVGGKNKLPMSELSQLFKDAGCKDVQTFIQSGNVVFSAPEARANKIIATVEAGIEQAFGFRPPVLLRTAAQLVEVVATNPYLTPEIDLKLLYVMFLRELPLPERHALLDPARSAPDSFQIIGKTLYLCLPTGAANTKLTNAYFDSKLATIGTSRNWRTVKSLCELANSG